MLFRSEGRVYGEFFDEDLGYWITDALPNAIVEVYSEHNYYTLNTGPDAFFSIEVPGNYLYYINVPNPPGITMMISANLIIFCFLTDRFFTRIFLVLF